MRFFYYLLFYATLFIVVSCASHNKTARAPTTIFEQSRATWEEYGDAQWSFEGAELIGQIADGAGFVMTNESYDDFVLTLDFYPDSTINSGIFVRCPGRTIHPDSCHEVNIWDLHPNQDYRTGAIVKQALPLAHLNTINTWNHYDIRCLKSECVVTLNNQVTAKVNNESIIKGYIGLQAMGSGKIKFKNIKITRIAS